MLQKLVNLSQSKWAHRIVLIAVFVIIGRYLTGIDWSSLSGLDPEPVFLVSGFAFFVLFYLYNSCLWMLMTVFQNCALPFPETVAIWGYACFGKYLPLKIAGAGYKIGIYNRLAGCPKTKTAQICYAEIVGNLIGGALLALVLAVFNTQPQNELLSPRRLTAIAVAAVVMVVFFMPVTQKLLVETAQKIFKLEKQSFSFGHRQSALLLGLYTLSWLLPGTGIFFTLKAFRPELELGVLPAVCMFYSLAGILGNISVFAPSGIGVREGVLLMGLGHYAPAAHIAMAVLAGRIISTLADVTLIAGGFVYLEKIKRLDKQTISIRSYEKTPD